MVYPILVGTLGDAFTDHEFTPHSAKQDRIDINWDGLRLYGNDLDGLGLLNALSRHRGDEVASSRFRELPDGRSTFFNAPQTRGATCSVRFRSKSNVKYRTPAGLSLIAGRVSIHRRTNDREQTAFFIGGNLSFNPTRFFRHSFLRDLVGFDIPVEMLLTAPLPRNNGIEHILDDNDNCIVETTKLRHAKHATYTAHRDAYILSSFDFLRERLSGALLAPGTSPLLGTEVFNLKRVETYWERACQSPLEYIRVVADRLMSYRSGVRVAAHLPPTSYNRDGNALSVELPLRDGVTLHVYAKTNLRVRYEVRHDLQTKADPIGTAHTTGDVREVLRWLEALAQDAADLLNNVHEFGPPTHPPAFELDHLYTLISAVTDATDNGEDALRILSMLVALDGVSGKGTDALAFGRLKSAGILRQAGRNTLRLAPEFQAVTSVLRSRYPDTTA